LIESDQIPAVPAILHMKRNSKISMSKRYTAYGMAFFYDVSLWTYTIIVCHQVVYHRLILKMEDAVFSWAQPLIAAIFGLVFAGIGFSINWCSIGKRIKGIYQADDHPRVWFTPYVWFGTVIVLLTLLTSFCVTQISLSEFFSPSGMSAAKRIIFALMNPNFSILGQAVFAVLETVYMAFMATVAAVPIAFIISFPAARNLSKGSLLMPILYSVIRFFLNLTRSIEPLVWAIIFSVWVGIGPFSGMLALALHSVASLAKLYSEQIESIGDGPLEAIIATGAHPIQVIWFGVVPQVILPFLSFTIYRWDINVRMATVIGLVGGGGIGTLLMQYQGQARWNEVGLIIIVIATAVWMIDYASAEIRDIIK
jgi:phosphonate transport system permease protein